jgi:hypothetical protein
VGDYEQELADPETAVLDQLETAHDQALEGTVPLEAARRRNNNWPESSAQSGKAARPTA